MHQSLHAIRYLRLLGALATVSVGLLTLGELGCSASGDIKKPPPSGTGGVLFSLGGANTQDTSMGGATAGTGGVYVATGGAVACTDTETRCSGACYDLATAHDHCGNCDKACGATEVCLDGVCGCPLSNPDGDAGPITDFQVCGSICADLLSSKTNCGTCDKVCAFQRCIRGKCGCADTDIICGSNKECFDPLTTHDHCGDCNTACGKFEECVQGECVQNCEKYGTKECGGVCVNIKDNTTLGPSGVVENCGACGTSCPTDKFACKGGECVCSASAVLATVMHCVEPTTQKDLCVDTATDRRFCGSCEVACDLGKSCENGKCVCSATSLQCPDGCYDGASDPKHCGSCDTVCDVGFRCVSSSCVCNEGLNLCANRCADYNTEPANCGGCGQACGAGQACTAGKCQCDAGLDLCSGTCFDLKTTHDHCGDCAVKCATAQSCLDGKCACSDGLLACGLNCVDAQNDAKNCGECDKPCTATQMCQGGTCRPSVVKVQTKSSSDNTTQISVNFNVCNTTSESVSIAGYTLKYWYTSSGLAQVAEIDYTPLSPKPTTSVVVLALAEFREEADTVMQLTFGTGTTLAGNACSGDIQLRIHPKEVSAGSNIYDTQTTDYSYIAHSAYADNANVTVYNSKGLLVWGLEPAPAPQ